MSTSAFQAGVCAQRPPAILGLLLALLASAASAAELQKLAGDVSVLIGKWYNVIIVPAADGVFHVNKFLTQVAVT